MKEELEIEVVEIPVSYKYRIHQVIDGKRTGDYIDGREIFVQPHAASEAAKIRIAESYQTTRKFVGGKKHNKD